MNLSHPFDLSTIFSVCNDEYLVISLELIDCELVI